MKENTVCAFDTRIGLFKEVTQRLNGLSGLLFAVSLNFFLGASDYIIPQGMALGLSVQP